MTYEFLQEAQAELREATLAYESKESGLGIRFRNEIARVIERVLFDPYLWRERSGGYRRVNVPDCIREDRIIIAAVAHGHKEPNYWKVRVENL